VFEEVQQPRDAAQAAGVSGGVGEGDSAGASSGSPAAVDAGGAEQTSEGYAVLPEEAELQPLQQALRLLTPLLPPAAGSAMPGMQASSRQAAPEQAPAQQQQQPPRAQPVKPPHEWEAARERNTQVCFLWLTPSPHQVIVCWQSACQASGSVHLFPGQLRTCNLHFPSFTPWPASAAAPAAQVILPTSLERDVPDWFFQRTGQEMKAAFMAAVRRREQGQVRR
jgi:hypothetical protein